MSWSRRLLNLFRPDGLSRDIDREIEFHIAECADALRAEGMPESEALSEARRRFGNRGVQTEDTREADIIGWLDSLVADVRYALRQLHRSPVFTIVAVASLAIGIGANAAIYTLMDSLVLRSLPVPDAEQLVQVTLGESTYFTNPLWEQIRDRQSGFSSIAAFGDNTVNVAESGEAQRKRVTWVSGQFFSLIGLQAAAGRLIYESDDVRGCAPRAVLGHGFWQSEYGGAANVIGTTIAMEGHRFQIIGVVPAQFRGPEVGRDVQIYAPLCSRAVIAGPDWLDRRSTWWLQIIGRRQEDVSIEDLSARIAAIAPASLEATTPDWSAEDQKEYRQMRFGVRPAPGGVSDLRDQYRAALRILMGVVGILLLIACANVANLLIARATAREREVAIRLSIGATRMRIVRQLMTESALLALLGAIAGLIVAQWGTRALVGLIGSTSNPVALDLAINPSVLAFTAAAAAVSVMLFGLVPSWRATRVTAFEAMKSGRGTTATHARFTIGKALVVTQVALSLVVLVGAGLLVGSLRNLRTMDPGFTADGVVLVAVDLSRAGEAPYGAMRRTLLERMRTLPGVRAASTADITPVGRSTWNDFVIADGAPATGSSPVLWFNEVSDRYFETLDTRIVAGRDFDGRDGSGTERSAIVDEAAATRLFGTASAIGRRIRTKTSTAVSDPYTIVGIAEDAVYRDLREAKGGTVYLAAAQNPEPGASVNLQLRTAGPAAALVPAIKSAVADVAPAATLEVTMLSTQLASSLRRERMLAVLSASFAGVAILLSMIGLYGVMSYTVARRRNEIGVRIALGADRARVLDLVLRDVGRVILLGLCLGMAAAMALGSLLQAFLFGVQPADPRILALAVAFLAMVGITAGLVPAVRASRIDPVAALREE